MLNCGPVGFLPITVSGSSFQQPGAMVLKLCSDVWGIPQPHFFYNAMSKNNFDISTLLYLLPSKERTGGGLLKRRLWTFGFRKMRRISWPAENRLASQGLCSIK